MFPMRPVLPDNSYNINPNSYRISTVHFDDFECCSAICLTLIFFILFTAFILDPKCCAIRRPHSNSCIVECACGSVVGWVVYWHLV